MYDLNILTDEAIKNSEALERVKYIVKANLRSASEAYEKACLENNGNAQAVQNVRISLCNSILEAIALDIKI